MVFGTFLYILNQIILNKFEERKNESVPPVLEIWKISEMKVEFKMKE